MVDSVRLKGENIRRLARLQDLGFGDLAVELAKLNDDPAKLKAALDQLANGRLVAPPPPTPGSMPLGRPPSPPSRIDQRESCAKPSVEAGRGRRRRRREVRQHR